MSGTEYHNTREDINRNEVSHIVLISISVLLLNISLLPTNFQLGDQQSLAQSETDGSGTLTTGNMTTEGGSENATETNTTGSISSFHSSCPFSFC